MHVARAAYVRLQDMRYIELLNWIESQRKALTAALGRGGAAALGDAEAPLLAEVMAYSGFVPCLCSGQKAALSLFLVDSLHLTPSHHLIHADAMERPRSSISAAARLSGPSRCSPTSGCGMKRASSRRTLGASTSTHSC
jgi:hypothetical protein